MHECSEKNRMQLTIRALRCPTMYKYGSTKRDLKEFLGEVPVLTDILQQKRHCSIPGA